MKRPMTLWSGAALAALLVALGCRDTSRGNDGKYRIVVDRNGQLSIKNPTAKPETVGTPAINCKRDGDFHWGGFYPEHLGEINNRYIHLPEGDRCKAAYCIECCQRVCTEWSRH